MSIDHRGMSPQLVWRLHLYFAPKTIRVQPIVYSEFAIAPAHQHSAIVNAQGPAARRETPHMLPSGIRLYKLLFLAELVSPNVHILACLPVTPDNNEVALVASNV